MRVYFYIVCLLLTSCATQVTSLKEDVDRLSNENSGYLLLGVQSNRDLKELQISGTKFIKLTHNDIKKGTNYLMVDLPAGEYEIRRVKLDGFWNLNIYNDEDLDWSFRVVEGKVSYVGHFDIRDRGFWSPSARIELANRTSEALEFLEEHYPSIKNKRGVVFSGPGEDGFLDFLNERNKGDK